MTEIEELKDEIARLRALLKRARVTIDVYCGIDADEILTDIDAAIGRPSDEEIEAERRWEWAINNDE